MRLFFSNVLIILGVLFLALAGFLFWERTTPQRLTFDIDDPQSLGVQEGSLSQLEPKVLVIKELGIELSIYPARLTGTKWEATTKGVSYLTSSPKPGEKGNSIIYGHNWKNLLGNLTKAVPGQEVEIIFSDFSERNFVIKYVQVVLPSDTGVLASGDDSRLTIYTCTGFLDSKRFVVTAFPSEDQGGSL